MKRYIICMGQGHCDAFESDSMLQAVARAKQIANDNGKTVQLMELLAVIAPDKKQTRTQEELNEAMRIIERSLEAR